MASLEAPQVIFGCGGLGNEFVSDEAVGELLKTLQKLGVERLDTAALYPPTDIGASQRLLGRAKASQMGFAIDTKVMISMASFSGTLEPEKIAKSAAESVEVLKFRDGQRINVFYPHAADISTPLEDQAAGFNRQYKKGIFDKLGVCNFTAEMLQQFIDICDREGYVKPTVYQGIYNLIDRRHEGAVLDIVRKNNMQFVAHSPHASGFLHGALTTGNVDGTRFSEGNIMSMDARRYDKNKYHDAIRFLDKSLEPHGITKTEIALRWLAFHSQLKPSDAIIFGSSKLAQVKENVAAINKGPLPQDILVALDDLWKIVS
ncbi:putative aldo/keto reductase [Stachybotrys elegans]|uniref:Aldo/keto reductase n=1 Tax=Stachybotrys elegans TaxID=80388 RepID=A0A8K0SD29_9HYPO|nr:putative aldo/keto reductase [Stachybotrys elegans]